jgi:hypothetical protein
MAGKVAPRSLSHVPNLLRVTLQQTPVIRSAVALEPGDESFKPGYYYQTGF